MTVAQKEMWRWSEGAFGDLAIADDYWLRRGLDICMWRRGKRTSVSIRHQGGPLGFPRIYSSSFPSSSLSPSASPSPSWSPEWDKMRCLLAAKMCHLYLLFARNPNFRKKSFNVPRQNDPALVTRPSIYSQGLWFTHKWEGPSLLYSQDPAELQTLSWSDDHHKHHLWHHTRNHKIIECCNCNCLTGKSMKMKGFVITVW